MVQLNSAQVWFSQSNQLLKSAKALLPLALWLQILYRSENTKI